MISNCYFLDRFIKPCKIHYQIAKDKLNGGVFFLPKLNISATAKLNFHFSLYPQGNLDYLAGLAIQDRKPRTLGLWKVSWQRLKAWLFTPLAKVPCLPPDPWPALFICLSP